MKKYKVYISGAITGRERQDVLDDFNSAEELWRMMGVDVVNPLRNGVGEHGTWREHMKADTAMLWDCDAIHFIPGWELSRGARIEYAIAHESGMDMFIAENGIVNIETYNTLNGMVSGDNLLRVLRITQAIRRVIGVSFAQIQDKRRHRSRFFARMVFAHECRALMMVKEIARIMNTNGASIRYFLRKFNDEQKHNPEFAKMHNEILTIINSK